LATLQPDIAVVSECANEAILRAKSGFMMAGVSSMTWVGDACNKGLAVLAFGDYRVQQVAGTHRNLQWIDRVIVDGPTSFNLIPVWASNHRATEFHSQAPRTRQPTQAIRLYREFIASAPTVMAGASTHTT